MTTARQIIIPALAMILAAMSAFGGGAQAQAPVSGPAASSPMFGPVFGPSAAYPPVAPLDCSSVLLNLSSCLTYVEEGSNVTVPDKGCCPSLASLVNNQPVCLCQLLSSSDTFGIKIDTAKALTLPTVCRVDTPPPSLCSEIGIPIASTTGLGPAPASGGPLEPGSPSGSLPSSGPAAGPNSNTGCSRIRATGLAFLLVLSLSIIVTF